MSRKSMFCVLAIVVLTARAFAQSIYVNRVYQEESGNPVFNPILNLFGIQWSSSVTNVIGDLITVGHTAVSGQGENVFLEKRDAAGTVIFSVDKNTSGTNNDYGVSVCLDPGNGDIFVCGTTDNGGSTNFDVIVYKYSSTGTLLDSAKFDSGNTLNDVGSCIKLDGGGNVIIAATAQNSGGDYDYLVLKYSNNLNYIISNVYDYTGLNDIAIGLEISSLNGKISLIGASASSTVAWDYAQATFDGSSLSFDSDVRNNVPGTGLDQALAYCKDASNNIYITGKAWNGSDFDIKTIKITAAFSIAWTATLDVNGFDDLANTIGVDLSGNVIIGGFATRSGGKKDLICVKHNGSSGASIWQYIQKSEDVSGDAFIKTLGLNSSNGNIYFVGGEKGNSGFKQSIVGRINSDGTKTWQRKVHDPNSDILPSDLEVGSDGIYAISVVDSATDSYLTTKYEDFELDTARIFNGNGSVACKKKELIVGFLPSALDSGTIDNTNGTKITEFGDLSDFLTSSASSAMSSAFEGICSHCDIKLAKIYNKLKTTDTLAISRLGQNVPIPDFWTTLLLQFPQTITIQQAYTVLKTLPNIVSFAHPNLFICPLTSPPNDSLYTNNQSSLHATGTGTNADINAEEAWDLVPSGGRSYVRCGVFDSGIHWKHSDFGYDGFSQASSKIEGWQFTGNNVGQPLKTVPFPDSSGHGTGVAGIIAADRNSVKGVAGIAGGDKAVGNPGIQLYSLNVIGWWISNALDAMLETSLGNYTNPDYGFPINFSNNSWFANLPMWADTEVVSLREQVHFAWRQNITFVVARGDGGYNDLVLPACADSTWVLSVGCTGSNGQYKDLTFEEPGWAGSCGSGIDVAAPSVNNLIWTTGANIKYKTFDMSSAAAPHVSGVVGLLMTYMNDTTGAWVYKNLAPEDCEWIIQRSASNYPSYDTLTGYGRVNAGKALRMVEKPKYILYHYGTNTMTPHFYYSSLISNSDTVRLTEPYLNYEFPRKKFPKARYVVKTFIVNATIWPNQTYSTDSIVGVWPRNSSSFVYELPKGPKKLLNMHERMFLNYSTTSIAQMQGYVYQVWDTVGNFKGWWPCDTTFAALTNTAGRPKTVFEYSMLTKNKAVGLREYVSEALNVTIFPNPANKSQTLVVENDKETDCTIELYDMMGRYLRTVYKGKAAIGKTSITHDVERLPNSMYIYVIKMDGKTSSKKFLKE